MWFCLRKRRNRKAQQEMEVSMNNQGGWNQQFSDGQAPVEKYSHTVKSDSQCNQQMGSHEQHIAEAPDRTSLTQPAELWHGNYRS